MSEPKSAISQGRSYEEIGEYWSRGDAGEIWDRTAAAEFEVDIKAEKRYYPVERVLSQRISRLAEAQGVSSETLINLWLQEKLAQSGT